MCGITGILSNKDILNSINRANNKIAHRGPDDSGVMQYKNIALAHQRLSILDLSERGHQPMVSNDGTLTIVYNGEIYNHQEIRNKIGAAYSFKSSTDTETILAGYQIYGTAIFEMLNGIFALAILDKNKNELIVCRDQYGVKPLYYYSHNGDFVFGSEIKSFLEIPDIDKSLDYRALVNYLHFLYSPGEQTPFKHIKKLSPGHYIKVPLDRISDLTFTKYFEIPFIGEYKEYNEDEWINGLDLHFTNAVERQLMSDVPVGFFLSGGLDSSLIVAIARKITGKKLSTYTIDTDMTKDNIEGFTNDLHYAKQVAKHLDVDLQIVKSDVDIVKDFDKMIWHLDEPQADAAPLNVLNISQKARENGDFVLLGGTGGDDLFSGYRRHQAILMEKYLKVTPGFIAKGLKKFSSILPQDNPNVRRAAKLLKHGDLPQIERLAGYYEWLPLSVNKSLFGSSILEEIKTYDPSKILIDSLSNIKNEKEILNYLLYWDMKYFLTDHNLNYTDKMSMAVGIETRVPFLDNDLVKFSTQLPVNLKMKGKETKYLLKKVAERYLPKEVIYRSKTGFGAPVRKWITQDLDEMINDYLSIENIKNRGIFDSSEVHNLIKNNKKGKIDASYSVWSLLAIESWMRQFVDK